MVQVSKPVATITLGGASEPLPVTAGRITLDEGWSPFAIGTITVPISAEAAALDPRADSRVSVSLVDEYLPFSPEERVFDLSVRGNSIDRKAQTVTIDVASDEVALFDKRRLATTPDKSARVHESSVRAICEWALNKVGFTLAPGLWDADVTAYWPVTNLVQHPSVVGSVDGYGAASGTSSLDYSTAIGGYVGSSCLRWTASGTSWATVVGEMHRVEPGRTYSASAYMLAAASATGTSAYMSMRFFDSNGAQITAVAGPDVALSTSEWRRVGITGIVAPEGAATGGFYYRNISGDSGRNTYADAHMFYEGDEEIPYFDGDTASPGYTTAWDGSPQASSSRRIPEVERQPDLFSWRPGQKLWDFLRPFLEGSGLRLFCDELRTWRVIDPTLYEPPGTAYAQVIATDPTEGYVGNATEWVDEFSLDRDEWATGVVVAFRWRDSTGMSREAFDVAGTDQKVITIDRDTPPVAGAAAAILGAIQSRGDSGSHTTIGGFYATPGLGVTVTPQTEPNTYGKLRRVSFDLSSGLVDLITRDMGETPQ